MVLFSSAFLG